MLLEKSEIFRRCRSFGRAGGISLGLLHLWKGLSVDQQALVDTAIYLLCGAEDALAGVVSGSPMAAVACPE